MSIPRSANFLHQQVIHLGRPCDYERRFVVRFLLQEWIPDDEPDLDWFNCPRSPSIPDPEGFDQSPTWQAPDIQLDDGGILVLEYF